MATNNVNDEDVIPSWKIKKAYEICMKDPKLAQYFNDAPEGARQYIALEFYCTVFSGEVNDNLCAKYQQEVEEDLTREDVRYLAENDPNSASRMHFRQLYVEISKKAEKSDERVALDDETVTSSTENGRKLPKSNTRMDCWRR